MTVVAVIHGTHEKTALLRNYLREAGIQVKDQCSSDDEYILWIDPCIIPCVSSRCFRKIIDDLLERSDWKSCYLDHGSDKIKETSNCHSHAELTGPNNGGTKYLNVRVFCKNDDVIWTIINIIVFMILAFLLIWAIVRTKKSFM